MSIKARLALSISAFVAFALLVIGGVTVLVVRAQMIDRVDQTLAAAPISHLRGAGIQRGPDENRYTGRAIAIMVVNARGEVLYIEPSGFPDSPDPLPDLEGRALPVRSSAAFTTRAADGSNRRFRVYVRPLNGNRFVIAATPLDAVDATTRNLLVVVAGAGAAALAGIVAVTWLTIRWGLRPIDDMIDTADHIAHGDLSRRVELRDSASEVARLGDALNEMLARIETSFAAREASEQRLRQFVADASHELRTPLTSIRGYAELYRSGAATDPDGLRRVMERIESEGARMGQMVEDLLLLARLDQGRPLAREPLDLVRLAGEAVMDMRAADPARPVTLDAPPSLVVEGDAGRLRQALDNLLANVRAHTDPGVPARVTVGVEGDMAIIAVSDDGPGIPEAHATRVFDRFYRVDTARARATAGNTAGAGSGLGLSIVRSIIEAHGGSVTLDTAPSRGTTVTLRLPREQGLGTTD